MSEGIKFAVVSDIHYGRHNITETTERLKTLTKWLKVHEHELNSVIVLGDTVDKASDNTRYNEDLFKTVFNLLNSADMPVSFLAGDQDVNALNKKIIEKYIGSVHGVRDKMIGLDTSWAQHSGPQGKINRHVFEQYNFPQQGYVFSHHPLVPWDIKDNHWFSGNPEQAYSIDKEAVWKNVITKLNPRLVMNGHIREYKSGVFDGIPCYSVKPFNRKLQTSQSPSGYFYTVWDDSETIEITEHTVQENDIIHNIQQDIFEVKPPKDIDSKQNVN